MRFDTLDHWLEWQTGLHDKAIELGLDRVQLVADRLGIEKIAGKVITVAGTNGKGSTVATYETWLSNAGFSVASYTSPHLLCYNERIKFNAEPVNDRLICEAFESIDQAREDTVLTYFEFGTLASLVLMQQRQPDFAILEVGLGGRLDAVNIIDADLIHITPIGIDHQSWLGDTREKIGYEKAGVLRANRSVIVTDTNPPVSVLSEIDRLDCNYLGYGKDFWSSQISPSNFHWNNDRFDLELPRVLPGEHQIQNISGVIAGLNELLSLQEYGVDEIAKNLEGTQIPGRFQQIESDMPGQFFLDVGHNQDAARALSLNLQQIRTSRGKIIVLLGMLEDKQADLFVDELASVVDQWWCISLPGERGLSAAELKSRISTRVTVVQEFETIDQAFEHALLSLHNSDILLATGSFVTAEIVLRALSKSVKH